jgi:TnpA family transposase
MEGAAFSNRLGELRDRSLRIRATRASGLNLLVAAIVLWKTVYLGRADLCFIHYGLEET